jgi:hypothetical protein
MDKPEYKLPTLMKKNYREWYDCLVNLAVSKGVGGNIEKLQPVKEPDDENTYANNAAYRQALDEYANHTRALNMIAASIWV